MCLHTQSARKVEESHRKEGWAWRRGVKCECMFKNAAQHNVVISTYFSRASCNDEVPPFGKPTRMIRSLPPFLTREDDLGYNDDGTATVTTTVEGGVGVGAGGVDDHVIGLDLHVHQRP